MKFYKFSQNNVGGYFHRSEWVDEQVIIEAESEDEATDIFWKIIELHGVDSYCECCGYRWSDRSEPTELECLEDAIETYPWTTAIYLPHAVVYRHGQLDNPIKIEEA